MCMRVILVNSLCTIQAVGPSIKRSLRRTFWCEPKELDDTVGFCGAHCLVKCLQQKWVNG